MFTGHFAAAIAAKAAAPRAPLWIYVGASQFVDFIWAGLIIAGVEKVGFDPALPGSPLVLGYMPFTHSLPAALGWSLLAALVARRWFPSGTAAMVGLVAFSHWLADLLVHRPDLPLGFSGPSVGFALWNHPEAEMAVEIGLLGLATGAWVAKRVRGRQPALPALLFLAALVALQAMASILPAATNATALGQSALIAFAAVMLVAALVDRGKPRRGGQF